MKAVGKKAQELLKKLVMNLGVIIALLTISGLAWASPAQTPYSCMLRIEDLQGRVELETIENDVRLSADSATGVFAKDEGKVTALMFSKLLFQIERKTLDTGSGPAPTIRLAVYRVPKAAPPYDEILSAGGDIGSTLDVFARIQHHRLRFACNAH
ncbi:MAG: hypothetical protein AB7F86_20075 [Bdellovibrionales bacterium]